MTEKVSHDPVNLPRLGGTARRETFFSFFEGRARYSRGVHWLRSTRDGLSWTASEAQYDRRGYVGAPAVDGRVAVTCDRLGAGQDIARKAGAGRCRRSVENAELWTGIEFWPSDCSSVPWRRPWPRPLSPDLAHLSDDVSLSARDHVIGQSEPSGSFQLARSSFRRSRLPQGYCRFFTYAMATSHHCRDREAR